MILFVTSLSLFYVKGFMHSILLPPRNENPCTATTSSLFYANDDFAVQTHDFVEVLNSTKIKLLTKRDLIWQERYHELREFYRAYGNTDVPAKYCQRLSRWVGNQRQSFKKGEKSMTREKIEALEELNFNWDCKSASFYDSISKLRHYKTIHGHLNISRKDMQNIDLADFVSMQRHYYKLYSRGEKSPMTEERLAILKEVGINFDTEDGLSATWMKMFDQLLEFYRLHGHSKVPQIYTKNPKLGAWTHSQRTQYRLLKNGKQSTLNKARIKLLESVDFFWGVRNDDDETKEKLDIALIKGLERLKEKQKIYITSRRVYSQDAEELLAQYKKISLWG